MQQNRKLRCAGCGASAVDSTCRAWERAYSLKDWCRGLSASLLVMSCLIIPCAALGSATEHVLYFSTAFGPPISTPERTGFFDRIMQELCARIGYQVVIETPPAERALMLANAGVVDGDGPRIPDLDDAWNYTDLIRVQEKLLDIDFVAFTREGKLAESSWDSLWDGEIAIITGWKILEHKFMKLHRLTKVRDVDQLFLLLKNGRTDIVVIDRYSGLSAANRLGMNDIEISSEPLISKPMYLYLNRNHADLANRINTTLKTMKESGIYQRIYEETLNDVIRESTR